MQEHQVGRAKGKSSDGRGRSAGGGIPQKRERNPGTCNDAIPTDVLVDRIRTILWAMLADFRTLLPNYGYADYCRDRETVDRRLAAEGIQFATVTLPKLFDAVLSHLENGTADYPSFKIWKAKKHPHFLRGLISPLYADPTLGKNTVKNLECLYAFCVAFKKLEGPYKTTQLAKQLADFVQTDVELGHLDFLSDDRTRQVALNAQRILKPIIAGLDPYDPNQSSRWIPRPGPGANRSTKHKSTRYRPGRTCRDLENSFPVREWMYPPYSPNRSAIGQSKRPQAKRWRVWKSNTGVIRGSRRVIPFVPDDAAGLPSKLEFVFKTFGKARIICVEYNERQWLQQALRRGIYRRLECEPQPARGQVNFTNQQINANLALASSKDRVYGTMDMSEGSDRVARSVVEFLFRSNLRLFNALEAVSAKDVELPNLDGFPFIQYLPLNKMAPMGSAICFPIMSLVHYALVRGILEYADPQDEYSKEVFVYGDDIIVPSKYQELVYELLPMFGMKINVEKSFYKSFFRESCGENAFHGESITPPRFRRVLNIERPSGKEFASAQALESAYYEKGMYETSRVIRLDILRAAEKLGIRKIPFVTPQSRIFGFIRRGERAYVESSLRDFMYGWSDECIADPQRRKGKQGPAVIPRFPKLYGLQCKVYRVPVLKASAEEGLHFSSDDERYLRYLVESARRQEFKDGTTLKLKLKRVVVPESSIMAQMR